jgi:hypothetical protein
MGGFSAQVQQPQTGQSSGGKMGHFADQAAKSASGQVSIQPFIPNSGGSQPQSNGNGIPSGRGFGGGMAENQLLGGDMPQNNQMTNAQLDASTASYNAPGGPGAVFQPQSGGAPTPMGKGGRQTNSATSGQPRAGMPNQYSNTVGQWDNAQIQQPQSGGGKGKG